MGQTDRAGGCHLQVLPPKHRPGEVIRGGCCREEDVRSLGRKLQESRSPEVRVSGGSPELRVGPP